MFTLDMKTWLNFNKLVPWVRQQAQQPLTRGALFLMASSIIISVLGFVWWLVITRYYSAEQVGLFSALISAAGVLVVLGRLGFDIGLVRFLPGSTEPIKLINSCLTLSGISVFSLAVIFLCGLQFWSPALLFMRNSPIFLVLFVLCVIAMVTLFLQRSIFITRRHAEYLPILDTIQNGSKIVVVVFMGSLGVLGLLTAYSIAIFLAFLLVSFILLPRIESGYFPSLLIRRKVVNDMVHYSLGNQVATVLGSGATVALPLMVANTLGAEKTAYFQIAWVIMIILLTISGSFSLSLFAEGSNAAEQVYSTARKCLKWVYLLLTPAVLIIWIFGAKILTIFGAAYSENASGLLSILAISCLLTAFSDVIFNVKMVEKNIKFVIAFRGVTGLGALLFTYLFAIKFGLIGIGVGWLIAQGIGLAMVLVAARSTGWLKDGTQT